MSSPGVLLTLKKGALQGWAVASQSHNLLLQGLLVKNEKRCHGGIMYSIGNIVNNIVITLLVTDGN